MPKIWGRFKSWGVRTAPNTPVAAPLQLDFKCNQIQKPEEKEHPRGIYKRMGLPPPWQTKSKVKYAFSEYFTQYTQHIRLRLKIESSTLPLPSGFVSPLQKLLATPLGPPVLILPRAAKYLRPAL